MVEMIRGEVPAWADGYGSGYGYGYGYGYGSGDGYGYGYGYGSGDGSGDGYGYGYGYGSGDGSVDGYGSPEYWAATVPYFALKWPTEQQSRLEDLRAAGAKIAFWRSDAAGCACNGGNSKPVQPGTVETISGPLRICTQNALHATLMPTKWSGDRWWIVALIGEVQRQDDKMGALTREIIGECL